MDGDAGAEGTSSRSECEDYSENNEISSEFEDAEADATNAFSTNGTQFTKIISGGVKTQPLLGHNEGGIDLKKIAPKARVY